MMMMMHDDDDDGTMRWYDATMDDGPTRIPYGTAHSPPIDCDYFADELIAANSKLIQAMST